MNLFKALRVIRVQHLVRAVLPGKKSLGDEKTKCIESPAVRIMTFGLVLGLVIAAAAGCRDQNKVAQIPEKAVAEGNKIKFA